MAEEKEVGKITHYFGKISVGIIELSDELVVGDQIISKAAPPTWSSRWVPCRSSMMWLRKVPRETRLGSRSAIRCETGMWSTK